VRAATLLETRSKTVKKFTDTLIKIKAQGKTTALILQHAL